MQENNAITHRITQLQTKWFRKVKEDTKLVRWLIEENEYRMLEAFVLLESGEHGVLSEFFFPFTIPFENNKEQPFALKLKNAWIDTWNNQEYRDEVSKEFLPQWQSQPYENTTVSNREQEFLECMSSFAQSVSNSTKLVLVLLPQNLKQLGKQWGDWVLSLTEISPNNLRIMVVDYKDSKAFRYIPTHIKEVSIEANLRMFQAMKEIVASSGDAHEPGIAINTCLLNVFEELQKENIRGVELWGNKGIEVAKEAGSKSLEATVLITYGSAYFQLKKYGKALKKFKRAITACYDGITQDDTVCETLLIQGCNFTAATCHVKRNKSEAIEYYLKTAEIAKSYQVYPTYIESIRLASELLIKQFNSKEAYKLLNNCLETVKELDKTMLRYTTFYLVCGKLYDKYYGNNELDIATKVENLAMSIWGENWKKLKPEEMIEPVNMITNT